VVETIGAGGDSDCQMLEHPRDATASRTRDASKPRRPERAGCSGTGLRRQGRYAVIGTTVRQEIERRGGSSPENFTDPGVTYEMRPRPDNGFVFTVPGVQFGEGTYRCAALDQHDGTAIYGVRQLP
jgi:hypothetical protein